MRLAGLIISTLVAVTVAAPAALPVEQAVQSTEAVEAAEAVDAVETVEAAQGNRAVEAVQEAKAPAAGGCSVGFVFARGSTEISPLVSFALHQNSRKTNSTDWTNCHS